MFQETSEYIYTCNNYANVIFMEHRLSTYMSSHTITFATHPFYKRGVFVFVFFFIIITVVEAACAMTVGDTCELVD